MHMQVDALWQPDLNVIPGNLCNAYQGLESISADRVGVPCTVCCRSSEGAVIRCSASHCTAAFHPLCARNAGHYLTVRDTGSKTVYKAFCAQHSQQARAKDRDLGFGVEVVTCGLRSCAALGCLVPECFNSMLMLYQRSSLVCHKDRTSNALSSKGTLGPEFLNMTSQ